MLIFASLVNSLTKSKLFKLWFKALKSTTPLTLFLSIRFLVSLSAFVAKFMLHLRHNVNCAILNKGVFNVYVDKKDLFISL